MDTMRTSIKRVGDSLGAFKESICDDLNQHDSLLIQVRAEMGTRPPEMGASTLSNH
jgi:hypothetical protein